jgi:hypothetical protein
MTKKVNKKPKLCWNCEGSRVLRNNSSKNGTYTFGKIKCHTCKGNGYTGKPKENLRTFKKKIREAVANYIYSEGCECCRGKNHAEHQNKIAELLNIPKYEYEDDSRFDFRKYRTDKW